MCQHNIQGASRSSSKEGIWNLNFDAPHVSENPVRLRIWQGVEIAARRDMNFCLEPQDSVYQHGNSSPIWQFLTGVSILFPTKQRFKVAETRGGH